jgi:hypothetical protein
MKQPAATEYAPHYGTYVSLVPETDVMAALASQPALLRQLATGMATDREIFRYAPDKWSVREVLGHMIDTERVFGYRAFCISRGEHSPIEPSAACSV